MKFALKTTMKRALLAGIAAAAVSSASAQYAPLAGTYVFGDAVAGFTTGSGSELIVNLGLISSLTNGEQWNLSTLLGTGVGNAGFANLNNLNWGVIGISGSTYYSTVAYNASAAGNGTAASGLSTIFGSASDNPIGSGGYVISTASDSYSWYNNVDQGNGAFNSPFGELGASADATTPASGSFTFAQDTATWFKNGATGGATTNYFALSSGGILVFSNAVVTPPVPQIVRVTRTASTSTSTIYFATTNGFTYSLYYTNAAGLKSPVATWPASLTTVTGNGLTNSLSDITTDTNRFYRIGVQ
jgi:hypothetical protein